MRRNRSSAGLAVCLFAVAGCTVGAEGPATPGSASATAAEKVAGIAKQAEEIRSLSDELTARMDPARAAGDPTARAAEIEWIQQRAALLAEKNENLQKDLRDLETELHSAAGDPAPPIAEKTR
jgi:hypothetical protein